MINKKLTLKLVSSLLTLAAIYFGFRYFISVVSSLKLENISFNYAFLLISVLLFVGFYILLSIHWKRVCMAFDDKQDKQYLSFFASQPYKYLPTSLFTFSFRAKYSKELGMSLKKSSIAQLVENFNMLSTGVGVGSLFYLAYTGRAFIAMILVGLLFAVLYFSPDIFNVNVKERKLSVDKTEQLMNMGLTTIAWVLSGLSFYILGKALGVENIGLVEAIASNALAYTMGIFAFFAPGGIGVREWIFNIFNTANIAILSWRILTFIMDILLGIFAIVRIGNAKKKG